MGNGGQGEGGGGGPVLVPRRTCSGTGPSRGCYRPHGCGEAGDRPGSTCAIEVEGLKRRPPPL